MAESREYYKDYLKHRSKLSSNKPFTTHPSEYLKQRGLPIEKLTKEASSTEAIELLLKHRPNLQNIKNVGVVQKYTNALNIMNSVKDLEEQEIFSLSEPLTLQHEEINNREFEFQSFKNAQPFEIDEELFVYAGIHAKEALFDEKEPLPIPVDCIPCANEMFLAIELKIYPEAKHSFLIVRDDINKDKVNTFMIYDNTSSMIKAGGGIWPIIPMGSWEIGTPGFGTTVFQGWSEEEHIEMMCSLAFLVMTINQTRYVMRSPAGTRQQRRNAHRGFGKATDAWTRISWNIDQPVVAKEPYDAGFHKKALHFRRGHWRIAEEHHPKSKRRPHALVLIHRARWWTWIEGYWAGHPAFGTQKSYHYPKISNVA